MEQFPKGKPERPASGRDALRAAILAATTAVTPMHSADAAQPTRSLPHATKNVPAKSLAPQLVQKPRLVHQQESESASGLDAALFRKLLHKKKLTKDEEDRLETAVYYNEVPMQEQLDYMYRMFRPHGKHFDELYSETLSESRFSTILSLLDGVSIRLNRDYGLRDVIPTNISLLKHAEAIATATRPMIIPTEKGPFYCNTFFSRGFDGQVYQDIAAHCGDKVSDLNKLGFVVSQEGADVASRIIAPGDFEKEQVPDPHKLPLSISPLSGSDVIGMPVASYSVSPRGERKMYFSVLLPLTPRVQELLGYAQEDNLASYSNGLLFMLMPEQEGHVIATDEATEHITLNASGSSGSGMFIDIHGLLARASGFINERIIRPHTTRLPYAVSVVNAPQSHTSVHKFTADFERWKSEIAPALDSARRRR